MDITVADIGVILGVLHMDFLAKNVAILNCQLGPLEVAGQVISCHEHRPDEDGQVIVDETTLLLLAMCIMCQSRYGQYCRSVRRPKGMVRRLL